MTSTLTQSVKPGLAAVHRAVLYLRLSDLREEDLDESGRGKTFNARAQALRELAEKCGCQVIDVIVENDLSTGKSRNASAFKRRRILLPDGTYGLRVVRPGFRQVLDMLANGSANWLITEALDRTMRDPRDLEDLIDIVESRGLNCRSLSGSLQFTDGGTDAEITLARNQVSFANLFSRDMRRRVAAGRQRKALADEFGGGRRPYGFEPDGVTIRRAEGDEIVWMAQSLLAGIPLAAVARGLNERGAPSASGAPWNAPMVRSILLRSRNKGVLIFRGEEFSKAPWEPILEAETHDAVVARLKEPLVVWTDPKTGRRKVAPRLNNVGRTPTWLGSGLYLCMCGSAMEVHHRVAKNGRVPVYRCKIGGAGKHVVRDARSLDRFVGDHVVERLIRPDAIDLIVTASPKVDVPALRKERAVLKARLNDADDMFADGKMNKERFTRMSGRINAQLAKIDAELASTVETSPLTPLVQADDVRATWENLTLGQRRAVIGKLMRVTVLPPQRRGSGFDPKAVRVEFAA